MFDNYKAHYCFAIIIKLENFYFHVKGKPIKLT